jgi:hypothetical protein
MYYYYCSIYPADEIFFGIYEDGVLASLESGEKTCGNLQSPESMWLSSHFGWRTEII